MPSTKTATLDLPAVAPYFDGSQLCKVAPDAFVPDDEHPDKNRTALATCRRCPFREPCLTYAMGRPDERGIWGATTTKERARMRRAARPVATR